MIRTILALICAMHVTLVYSQLPESSLQVSLAPYYSHQRHIETGVQWGSKQFRRVRHGWGFDAQLTAIRKGVSFGIGLGTITDYHRRDSLTVSCGSQYCVSGYTISMNNDLYLTPSIGYSWNLGDEYSISVNARWSVLTTFRIGTKWYTYPSDLYDDWGSSFYAFRNYQHFLGGDISVAKKLNPGSLALRMVYQHPMNRLEFDHDSFAMFNIGLAWIFDIKK